MLLPGLVQLQGLQEASLAGALVLACLVGGCRVQEGGLMPSGGRTCSR